MSIEVTNFTKYPARAFGAIWTTVLGRSYREVLPKGLGGALLAEKEATAAKLGANVRSTHTAINGRYQRLCELGLRVAHANDNSVAIDIDSIVHVCVPKGQIETARLLRRIRYAIYAELLGGRRHVPVGIAEPAWSSVDAAAQTFPQLMKRYGEQLTERQPKPKAPKVRDPRAEVVAKLASLDGREKAWRTKAKRAATALKNIDHERKRLQRKLAKLDEQARADAVLAEARS